MFAASRRADSLNGQLAGSRRQMPSNTAVKVDHASLHEFDVPTYDGDVEQQQGVPKGAEAKPRLLDSDVFIVLIAVNTTD